MNLAFVSYETPFAPCGGIAAVLGRLPQQVQVAARRETVVLTPFHHRLEKMKSLGRSFEGSFGLECEDRHIVVNIYRHDDKVPFYFLLPEDPAYFAGQRHPYDVPAADLMRDALFFGRAVIQALHVLHAGQRWTLLLQDWEAATVALAAAGSPDAPRSFITLHNSYDAAVSPDDLWRRGINPQATAGHSILQRALGASERPVFTVSGQFARDLVQETLQTRILAPHLQGILPGRITGIDNGPFVDLAVSAEILAEAQRGEVGPLLTWKAVNRQAFLAALDKLQPSADQPVWGNTRSFLRDEAPWFVMAGRDDPRQKGYDVAVQAATWFLEQGGEARFLFFPVPGEEGRAGLGFLERLANRFPDSVLAFPFLFRSGFFSALRGAAFGIMPSFYEPFGMTNEFYLNGTAAIGRATGGITQQVIPLRSAACFSPAVEQRAAAWHPLSATPSGLLFREPDDWEFEQGDWAGINAGNYAGEGTGPDRQEERLQYTLFQRMADELRVAILDGTRIAREETDLYCRMVTAGIAHIRQSFSWEKAAQDYIRHIG